ncbi:MAG: hypothetical protein A2275_05360 [Bacteroidetes bacterium RIFOXYA12_FULL_35_11]|nr:MAG: hypothetical protein A2X01_19135 [Bacteroidetes bacterium GWF2_35_48]OFY74303.1 MAG: hypothetical protein A2275_05360 [Bacteroidetes bacterium RIFOXYA12_FULL_35_11]OFY93573.1 MAG: hypothetical protein A2491_00805 [Bacteroidetes bacterium RIFOXYC12_FULL_35_7]HBX50719.1 hypothetical protein [Bacteroidales bacterium]
MSNILLPEFKKMLLLLKKHDVDFLLIGGYAVIYYGYDRVTGDMDIWLDATKDNKIKLCKALNEFGINEESIKKVKKLNFEETHFFYFGQKPQKIDFLTKVNLINFKEAFEMANYFPLQNQQIPVIHYEHLILTKISNKRSKDKTDIEELQRILKYRKNS